MNKRISNIIVIFYLCFTFAIRLVLEPQLQGNILISLGLGAFALLFLWALVKSKILNPEFKLFKNNSEDGEDG